MSTSDTLVAALSQNESFVRRTLRAVLRNEVDVDDVVQETWIRALAHGRVPGRAWLAHTARNIAISRWRSDHRRKTREAGHGSREDAPSVESTVQRLEDRQRVVESVLGLAAPYRGVVIMRYEEGLSVKAIAHALGRSEGTIRSQLSRAHELLRTRLDTEFGERRNWAGLALPTVLGIKTSAATAGVAAWLVPVGLVISIALGAWLLALENPARTGSGPVAPVDVVALSTIGTGTVALFSPFGSTASPSVRKPAASITSASVEESNSTPGERPYEERLMPRAELFARSFYGDYVRATFSFPFGVRDDPGLVLTRNRWSVLFDNGNGKLDFSMTRRKSFVVDLGRVGLQAAADLSIQRLTFTDAKVTPTIGHSYFVISRGADSDLASIVHVLEHTPNRRCVFDWYTTDGTGRAQGSIKDDRDGRPIVDALVQWRTLLGAGTELKTPEVHLELRAGAGGGNPNTVDMTGNTSVYVDEVSQTPLDFTEPIVMSDPSVAYFFGGIVGKNRAFIVTTIEYEGLAKGDSNGSGEFILVVGGTEVARKRNNPEAFSETWKGEIAIESGYESDTYLEVANSSTGRVRLKGHFEKRKPIADAPFSARCKGFLGDHEVPVVTPIPPLESPRVELQLRNGRGGGNPLRIDMTGIANKRAGTVSASPLDIKEAITRKTKPQAFVIGGTVPVGQQFVLTSARMTGTITNEAARGYAMLYLGRKALITLKEPRNSIDESWEGEVIILPGEESRLFLEIADCASIGVVLEGRFERLP